MSIAHLFILICVKFEGQCHRSDIKVMGRKVLFWLWLQVISWKVKVKLGNQLRQCGWKADVNWKL